MDNFFTDEVIFEVYIYSPMCGRFDSVNIHENINTLKLMADLFKVKILWDMGIHCHISYPDVALSDHLIPWCVDTKELGFWFL